MPYVKTGYTGNTANSAMSLRGVDLPPVADFWGDWAAMQSRLRPQAPVQAQALREPRRRRERSMPTESAAVPDMYMDEGTFALPTTIGPNGLTFNQAYTPGMSMGAGQAPVATGYRRRV